MRAVAAPSLATREFSSATWRDFEALFGKYGGVQNSCWCMFYHRARPLRGVEGRARGEQNRRDHRRLLTRGEAHGVLVYSEGTPIGWCQFGRSSELPRIDAGRKYRALGEVRDPAPAWRITCFFVDRPHRRRGVSGVALHAALGAIAHHGGGTVEAYPSTDPRAVATWFGSVAMFEREGFRRVAPFGQSNVLVRRTVRAAAPSRARRSPVRPA